MSARLRSPSALAALLSLAGTLAPGDAFSAPAEAAPPNAAAPAGSDAEARYEEAQQHYIAGRHAQALAIFRVLAEQSDSPNAWFYVARCLREMGRLVDAYEALSYTAEASAARARTETRFEGTAEAARVEADALAARIGRLTFDLPVRPEGLEIEVNGRPLSSSKWDAIVPVMPGTARIWASAPGHSASRQEVDAPAGQITRMTIVLGPAGSNGAPSGPGTVGRGGADRSIPGGGGPAAAALTTGPNSGPASTGDKGGGGLLAGGIVSLAVGVGGWVVMGVMGSKASDRFAEIESTCNRLRCTDPALNDSIEEGQTWDTIANVGLGVGLVGTVLGGVLLTAYAVTDGETEPDAAAPKEPAPVAVSLVASPTGWFGLGGSF